jgi:hypothetical protein
VSIVSFLSRISLPHAQPAAAATIAAAFAHRADGTSTLEHDRLSQFVAQLPEHLGLCGVRDHAA